MIINVELCEFESPMWQRTLMFELTNFPFLERYSQNWGTIS